MSRIDELIRELCPEGVPYYQMGEVGTFIRGQRFVKDDMRSSGEPCIHYGEVYTKYGMEAQQAFSFLEKDLAKKLRKAQIGDVLIAAAGETIEDIGKPVVWSGDQEVVIHDALYAFKSKMDPKFVAHFLRTDDFKAQARRLISSSKISAISIGNFNKVAIPVPPLEVQREIVSILDKFTQLEAELEAELEARRTQYETLRDQYFFEQVKLQASLMTIAEIGEGGLLTDGDWIESKDQDPSGTVKLAQLADILEGTYQEKSQRFMTSIRADDLGCTLLEPHDILIARMPEPIGRACLFPQGRQPTVTVVDVALLRVKNPDINQRFVMHAINSHPIRRQIAARQSGGTRQRISRSKLATVQLPIPSVFEQNRMADLFDSLFLMSSDLSKGLPAEIEARRKQYEYYRNKLLTFKELDAA